MLLCLRIFADIETIPRNHIATVTSELEYTLSETWQSNLMEWCHVELVILVLH